MQEKHFVYLMRTKKTEVHGQSDAPTHLAPVERGHRCGCKTVQPYYVDLYVWMPKSSSDSGHFWAQSLHSRNTLTVGNFGTPKHPHLLVNTKEKRNWRINKQEQ